MQNNLDMNGFVTELQQHFTAHPAIAPRLPENEDRVQTLVDDGILFLRDYVPKDVVAKLVEKVGWLPSALRDNGLPEIPANGKENSARWGLYRVYDVATMYPEARLLIDDPVIQDIVNAYLAGHAYFCRSCIELRDTPLDPESIVEHTMPHFDNFYREVKVWLLLADVTIDNAPMRYYTKTHKFGTYRNLQEYLFYCGGLYRNAVGIHPYAIRMFQESSPEWVGVRRVYCTGTAGTVIIGDTRGIHHAWPLTPGHTRLDMYADYRMDNYQYR
jgi:hypothetical protein